MRWANSLPMIARRMAGSLGCGGGSGLRVRIFSRPRPALPGEAQMLQIGECDARHQRVSVQAGPGSALEMPETQFALELLVCLLAHPARFGGSRQGAHRCGGERLLR